MSGTGPYGLSLALVSYCNAALETACATLRTRYTITTDDLPRPGSATTNLPWIGTTDTKAPVFVAVESGDAQADNYPTSVYSCEVSILCLDAVFGASGRDAMRAALLYAEALQLAFQTPDSMTLGGATDVLSCVRESIALDIIGQSNPTIAAAVRLSIRVQES